MREGQGQKPLGTQAVRSPILRRLVHLYQAMKVQGKGDYRSLPPKQRWKNAGDRNQSRSGKDHQPLLLGKQKVLTWVSKAFPVGEDSSSPARGQDGKGLSPVCLTGSLSAHCSFFLWLFTN